MPDQTPLRGSHRTLQRLTFINEIGWSSPQMLRAGKKQYCKHRDDCLIDRDKKEDRFEKGSLLRYFRNPCDRDPPKGNFKNFKFFKNFLKILNVYFAGTSVYFWGESVYFWERAFTFGDNRSFWDFLSFFFVAGGVSGLHRSGGPRRGFQKNLSFFH